ncbi:MAG: hypothetical protein RIR70_1433 [Pseudomonadota bacterium]|jgi:excisionase family DNA binding protein
MTDKQPPKAAAGEDAFYSTTEAAKLLGVCNTTVQIMAEKGLLRAWKTLGGHRRISRESVDALRERRSLAASAMGKTSMVRVLVADDDPALRELYRATLSGWGLPVEVILATDGLEALILIERVRPDILLTDLNMAPVDGFQLLTMLRRHAEFNAMQILVISGLSPDEIARRGGLPRGIVAYGKPAPFDKIEGFIEASVLRKEVELAPA